MTDRGSCASRIPWLFQRRCGSAPRVQASTCEGFWCTAAPPKPPASSTNASLLTNLLSCSKVPQLRNRPNRVTRAVQTRRTPVSPPHRRIPYAKTFARIINTSKPSCQRDGTRAERTVMDLSAVGLRDNLPLEDLGVLGHGRFGLVKKVKSERTGEILVLKEIRFNYRRDVLETIRKEIYIHRRLSHPNITTVRGSYIKGNTYCGILMESVANYDLSYYLDYVSERQSRSQPVEEESDLLLGAFGCLSSGLAYLHEQKVKHKDIKPANVLIRSKRVLLTDFGLSTDFSDGGQSTSDGPTGCSRELFASISSNLEISDTDKVVGCSEGSSRRTTAQQIGRHIFSWVCFHRDTQCPRWPFPCRIARKPSQRSESILRRR